MAWQEQANCRGVDTDTFFRAGGGPFCNRDAVAVCAGCDVRAECLEDALLDEGGPRWSRYGVRGGLTPDERHALARERTRLAGWREVERSWSEWRLGRDRIVLHREEWPGEDLCSTNQRSTR